MLYERKEQRDKEEEEKEEEEKEEEEEEEKEEEERKKHTGALNVPPLHSLSSQQSISIHRHPCSSTLI